MTPALTSGRGSISFRAHVTPNRPNGAFAVTQRRDPTAVSIWRGASAGSLVHELLHVLVALTTSAEELPEEESAIRSVIHHARMTHNGVLAHALATPISRLERITKMHNTTDACPTHPGRLTSECGCSAATTDVSDADVRNYMGTCSPEDGLKIALLFLRVGTNQASPPERLVAKELLRVLHNAATPNAKRAALIASIMGSL